MNLKEKSKELKDKVVPGLHQWSEEMIDLLVARNPSLGCIERYLKRGAANAITQWEENIGRYIDGLILFIADENGNYNMDTLFSDALSSLDNMQERPWRAGMFSGTIGGGTIRINIPDNPIVSFFAGDIKAIRIAKSDLLELKNILAGSV